MLARLWRRWRAWRGHRSILVPYPDIAELGRRKLTARPDDGTIVAFHTPGGVYEAEKDRMLRSAHLLGLRAVATELPGVGSWVRNAGMKPGFLLEQRTQRRGPLLYLDVDAVLHRNPWPLLRGISCDMAAYYDADGQLLSGTLLLTDTPAAMDLLRAWRDGCAAHPDAWDQVVLQELLAKDAASAAPRFKVARLPVSCCWIFDSLDNEVSDGHVYIEHLQASREAATAVAGRGKLPRRLVRRRHRVETIEGILFGHGEHR